MAPDKSFHVVCEGITDFEVFKAIIGAVGEQAGLKFKAQPLFPPPNKQDQGGWGNLKIWCLGQASKLAGHNLRAAAMLLNAKPAPWASKSSGDKIAAALALTGAGQPSFILIQLDTDIAEDLVRELRLDPQIDFPLSPESRIQICEIALDRWLGGHAAHKDSLIFYCFTSLALENWVLTLYSPAKLRDVCGLSNIKLPYDMIHQPDKKLIMLGHKAETDGRLRKKPHIYKKHGLDIAAKLNLCRIRSSLLNKFCNTLLAA